MVKLLRMVGATLAALSLSACVSVKQPIGTSVGYVNDPALEGLWLSVPEDKKPPSYVHVLANDDNTFTVVGVAQKHGDDKASWGVLQLTTVRLGANRYMNVHEVSEDGKPKEADGPDANIPLLYTLSGDTLSLFAFDDKKTKDAIRAGRIEGKITQTKFGTGSIDSVAITADGPHLDAFLKGANAPDLFGPVMVLHRVPPPR